MVAQNDGLQTSMLDDSSAVATPDLKSLVDSEALANRSPDEVLAYLMQTGALNGIPFVKFERMYESLRSAEFDFRTALAELLDNSVEAKAKDIWLFIKTAKRTFTKKPLDVIDEVAVIDNGEGMSAEILARALVLGDSARPQKPGPKGIGRFGVGMTLGAISLARRMEVYSRANKGDAFQFTYLDLDEIRQSTLRSIPTPTPQDPPAEYADLLKGSAGTVVILSNCDRLQTEPMDESKGVSATDQIKDVKQFLGRTYRKFIAGGTNIWFLSGAEDDPQARKPERVYLHDPLYLLGPTRFETEKPEPKAKTQGDIIRIPLPIPGKPGDTADVTICMTLLPREWREYQGAGGSQHAKERGITDNEGVSILRADREVLYGPVPFIIGKKGEAKFEESDRWWSCEIAFPPELDEYFHVRYIKRGAEPVPQLRDKIRDLINPVVKGLREQIKNDWRKVQENVDKEQGIYAEAERVMAEADRTMPHGRRGGDKTPEQVEKELDLTVEEVVSETATTPAERNEKRQALATKPYSIVPVNYPNRVFFDTVHVLGKIIVKLNINHPFYKKIFEPLCGTIETMTEDSDIDMGADTPDKRLARRAMLLLLLAYGKAESMFEAEEDDRLDNMRMQWGIALATAVDKMPKE